MLKIENCEVVGWEHAIRGMRNPKNSWEKSDSLFSKTNRDGTFSWIDIRENSLPPCSGIKLGIVHENNINGLLYELGPNDHKLMMSLAKSGPVHAKYRRMITVYLDITAPLYWWKEFDTYKVGTVANSCSTMHKIHDKEFTLDDFSHEHLLGGLNHYDEREVPYLDFSPERDNSCTYSPVGVLSCVIIPMLNLCRERYLTALKIENETGLSPKDIWWQMIQLLPTSYNQKRTVMLNYEVLHNIYHSRKDHKLDEWHTLCEWIEHLPYSEIITTPMSRTAMDVNVKIDDTMVKEVIEKVTNGGVILSKEEYEEFLKFKEGNPNEQRRKN